MPCGFCGRSGIAACSEVFLTKTKQAFSNCHHFVSFRYQSSAKFSENTPCMNVPIKCTIPGAGCNAIVPASTKAIWKYNMPEHIRTCHPEYTIENPDSVPLPLQMLHDMEITREEESFLKISEGKIPYKRHISLPPPDKSSKKSSKTKRHSRKSTIRTT